MTGSIAGKARAPMGIMIAEPSQRHVVSRKDGISLVNACTMISIVPNT